MSIPSIEPYLPPAAGELPAGPVRWRPEPARAVLLIHDMQRYFLRFYAPDRSPLRELLANVTALRAFARQAGIPVVYSAQPADVTRAQRGLLSDVWGPGLTARPEEQEIWPELAPAAGDHVLEKTRYSAFHATDLLAYLRREARDQLWICGVFAHIGCMLTAFDAFMHDVKPFIVADAVADFSRQHHDLCLSLVASRCGVALDTASLCASARPAGAGALALLQTELAALLPEPGCALERDAELGAIGLDSVRRMELIERLARHGFALHAIDVMECDTLGSLLALVQGAAAESAHTRQVS